MYDDDTKHAVMHKWAVDGTPLAEIAKETGIHPNTISNWRNLDKPQNWNLYRESMVREASDVSVLKVRKMFGKILEGQVEDAEIVRKITRHWLTSLANQINNGEVGLSRSNVAMLKDLGLTLGQIQRMTAQIFGLPNLRIAEASMTAPLEYIADGEEDLDELETPELVRLLSNMVRPDDAKS